MSIPATFPVPFLRSLQPLLEGGEPIYLRNELNNVETAINSILLWLPQPATKAPAEVADGMVRLSRAPWRPVVGTTTDAWVFYDAPSGSWLLL